MQKVTNTLHSDYTTTSVMIHRHHFCWLDKPKQTFLAQVCPVSVDNSTLPLFLPRLMAWTHRQNASVQGVLRFRWMLCIPTPGLVAQQGIHLLATIVMQKATAFLALAKSQMLVGCRQLNTRTKHITSMIISHGGPNAKQRQSLTGSWQITLSATKIVKCSP